MCIVKNTMCKPENSNESDESFNNNTDSVITSDEEAFDDSTEIIRAKWMFDGCETIDDIIAKLSSQIEYYRNLKDEGWYLTGKVDDDYGFIKKDLE